MLALRDSGQFAPGGILPAEFLQKVGVQVETKYGTA